MNPYLASLFTSLRLAMQAGSAYEVLQDIIHTQPRHPGAAIHRIKPETDCDHHPSANQNNT
jgi:hypothetical protein